MVAVAVRSSSPWLARANVVVGAGWGRRYAALRGATRRYAALRGD